MYNDVSNLTLVPLFFIKFSLFLPVKRTTIISRMCSFQLLIAELGALECLKCTSGAFHVHSQVRDHCPLSYLFIYAHRTTK